MALFNYECDEVKRIIEEVSPNYPQLTTYEKEWLYFHKYGYIPGVPVELEYETVNVNPTGHVSNAIPYQYKRAILKGNTLKKAVNNLFNGDVEDGDYDISTGEKRHYANRKRCADKIKINPSTTYTISGITWFLQYDENGNYLGHAGTNNKRFVFTSKDNAHFLTFYNVNNESDFFVGLGNVEPLYELVSIKMPVLTTSNEDGTKTNILTVNEDVKLCSIGDVKDELNLLTGEVVQSVYNLQLTGDEGWGQSGITNDNYFVGYTTFTTNLSIPISKVICDKLDYNSSVGLSTPTTEGINIIGDCSLRISLSKTKVATLSDFINWIRQEQPEINFVAKEKSVKTVDLAPLNKPYEGTNHYHLTANIPCEAILEVPVVSTGKQTLEEINN